MKKIIMVLLAAAFTLSSVSSVQAGQSKHVLKHAKHQAKHVKHHHAKHHKKVA